MSSKATSNEVSDWYSKIPDKLKTKYHNPSFKNHQITLPFRMLIIGASGSGKSTLALEIIKRMKKTFNLIILCVKSAHEPLYEFLRSKLNEKQLMIFEGVDNVPPLELLDQHGGQILTIFDDLVLERNQEIIGQYFIRGRKIADGVSCMYLTQSYYDTPSIIRKNCNFFALKKLSNERDLNRIMSEFSLGVDKPVLLDMYNDATEEQRSFLMIDIDAPHQKRFRKNFLQVMNPSSFSKKERKNKAKEDTAKQKKSPQA